MPDRRLPGLLCGFSRASSHAIKAPIHCDRMPDASGKDLRIAEEALDHQGKGGGGEMTSSSVTGSASARIRSMSRLRARCAAS